MKLVSIILIIMLGSVGIFGGLYGANLLKNDLDQKKQEEWREIREKMLGEIRKEKLKESKTNLVIIYSANEQNQNRLSIEPYDLIIYLEEDDIVTWVNEADYTATVQDIEKTTWSTGEFRPEMTGSIQINKTGFYEYVVDAGQREIGSIVAISNETDSLPLEIRMKMGMSMVSADRHSNPALIGVGIGAPEDGVQITINKEELTRIDDAELFYYDMYRSLIPFDVPITIDFGEPFRHMEG